MSESLIYHPFDGFVVADAPTRWTRELVSARLVEAAMVISATVKSSRPGMSHYWPEIRREWHDYVGRGDEARKEVWDSWGRERACYDSHTISRAEEAALWPMRHVAHDEGAARVLIAYVTAMSKNRQFGPIAKRKGWATSTVTRKRKIALDAITAALVAGDVTIREARVFP